MQVCNWPSDIDKKLGTIKMLLKAHADLKAEDRGNTIIEYLFKFISRDKAIELISIANSLHAKDGENYSKERLKAFVDGNYEDGYTSFSFSTTGVKGQQVIKIFKVSYKKGVEFYDPTEAIIYSLQEPGVEQNLNEGVGESESIAVIDNGLSDGAEQGYVGLDAK